MRLPRLFALLFSVSFGLALAASQYGGPGAVASAESFAPPASMRQYNPGSPSTFLPGDIFWAIGNIEKWLLTVLNIPTLMAQTLAVLGVPEPWAEWIGVAAWISFTAYLIYLVAGRMFSARV